MNLVQGAGAGKLSAGVAVFRDPATFAPIARILADSGFALTQVLPVDPSPWSGHLELVDRFTR